MCLASELTHGGAVLDVKLLARRALTLDGSRRLGLALLGDALAQFLGRPRDRLLGQLAIQRAVGDDRRAAVQLDQDAGGAGLVDVGLGEAERGRSVGVAVKLTVQLLGLLDERVGVLAQPQAGQVGEAHVVEVRPEDALRAG